jgi:hypothetical protein
VRVPKVSAFEEIRDDEYAEAVEAREIGTAWIVSVEAHAHLREATIGYIFHDEEITTGGKVEWASAGLPKLNGPAAKRWGRFVEWNIVRMIGYQPDFIILIDRNIWAGLDMQQRVALIDHELSHCQQATDEFGGPKFNQITGRPIWRIAAHDIEEFNGVIERNGIWRPDLAETARTIVDSLGSNSTKIGQQLAGDIDDATKTNVA